MILQEVADAYRLVGLQYKSIPYLLPTFVTGTPKMLISAVE